MSLAAGCRADAPRLETDADVQALRSKLDPDAAKVRLALAPVEVAYAETPPAGAPRDPARYPAKVDRERLREGLRSAIAAHTGFAAPRALAATDLAAAFAEAHERGDHVILRPVLTRLDCVFRGYNDLWIPNIVNWVIAWATSFWVADEDFAVEGELRLEAYSVASERLLYARPLRIERVFPLDDFERGWSWTGLVTLPATMEPEDWAIASESLAPIARFEAEKAVVLDVGGRLPAYVASRGFKEKDATVFALVCGVSLHKDGVAGAGAARADAERFAAFLRDAAGVPSKNLRMLVDQRASGHAVEQAFAEVLARARPGDTALVYWSGLGATVQPAGAAEPEGYLLPHDTDFGALARTGLSLSKLRELIARSPAGRVLVIVDSAFDGRRPGGRALVRDPGAEVALGEPALRRFTDGRDGKDVRLMVASAPGGEAIDVSGAGRGLLSYVLEHGASRAADEDRDGVVSLGELQGFLEREVAAEAGLEGVRQQPRLYRRGVWVMPIDPELREPWLKNAGRALAGGAVAADDAGPGGGG